MTDEQWKQFVDKIRNAFKEAELQNEKWTSELEGKNADTGWKNILEFYNPVDGFDIEWFAKKNNLNEQSEVHAYKEVYGLEGYDSDWAEVPVESLGS